MRAPVLYTDVHTPHSNAMAPDPGQSCCAGQGRLLLSAAGSSRPALKADMKASSVSQLENQYYRNTSRERFTLQTCYLLLCCERGQAAFKPGASDVGMW